MTFSYHQGRDFLYVFSWTVRQAGLHHVRAKKEANMERERKEEEETEENRNVVTRKTSSAEVVRKELPYLSISQRSYTPVLQGIMSEGL